MSDNEFDNLMDSSILDQNPTNSLGPTNDSNLDQNQINSLNVNQSSVDVSQSSVNVNDSITTTTATTTRNSIMSLPENKYDFFTLRVPEIKQFGNDQILAIWLWTDVTYSNDRAHFKELDPKVQNMIKMAIGFFFASDGIVFENIDENFASKIQAREVKRTYTFISAIELIHAESYGLQLDSIIEDPQEKIELMKSIDTIPSIKRMADWAIGYMNSEECSLLEKLIAFLCVEGIFFSSPFAFIFWLRQYIPKKMLGIVAANDLISRDENLHCEFAACLINTLIREGYSTANTTSIFKSAVEVACAFAFDTLEEGFLDMNYDLMSRHIKSVANRWSSSINNGILYEDCLETPFGFMENCSLPIKKNFFEKDGTEYQHAPPMLIKYEETY